MRSLSDRWLRLTIAPLADFLSDSSVRKHEKQLTQVTKLQVTFRNRNVRGILTSSTSKCPTLNHLSQQVRGSRCEQLIISLIVNR